MRYAPLEPVSDRWTITRLVEPNPLWGANGIAFGPDGRLYVAQFIGGPISAVDTVTGDVEVVVPLGSPVRSPDDLAFGADGSMYIADLVPGRVWRRTADGELDLVSDAVVAPNGITTVGNRLFVNEMRTGGRLFELFPDGGEPVVLTDGLAWGNAMQLGPDGFLYYPHMTTGEVWRIPPDGGSPALVAGEVDAPVAVRFDRAGTLVVLSYGPDGLITRVDLEGGARSVVRTGIVGLDNAAFDADNRMFVSSFAQGGISEVLDGGATRPVVRRGLNGPYGIAADRHGTVYVTDHFTLATVTGDGDIDTVGTMAAGVPLFVRGVAADGNRLVLTTGIGTVHTYDPAGRTNRERASGLREPTGVAIGRDGEVVVAESGAGRVLVIDAGDAVTVLAEGLDHPAGVAVAQDGTCYVSDDRLGVVSRLDEGEAVPVATDLGTPQGLVLRDGDLFTVDASGRRLLRISPATGECTVEVDRLAVGLPPGVEPPDPVSAAGSASLPAQFADLAVAPDGSLLVATNGDGSVLRLR